MAINNTSLSHHQLHQIFTKAEKIFFIGIGGISMSGIAEFCVNSGKEIFGYDRERNERTCHLEKLGKIKYYSTPDNITGMDMVVYTNAISEDNCEYRQAKKLKIPLISRANLLGYIVSLHKSQIGVSGMHGKSTTTSMLAHIFYSACKNPTVFCGAKMSNFDSSYKFGGKGYCIFEACEYQNSFLCLPTTDAVILNVDYDHPDFFDGIEEIKKSFSEYIKDSCRVFINCDDENSRKLCHPRVITFGFSPCATYRAEACEQAKDGVAFCVYKQGEMLCKCQLKCFGTHMIYNALCAFAVAHTHGISPKEIQDAMLSFSGSQRRMEFVKKIDTGADIFEDYAHHPTEIKASLSALSDMGYKNILCVFQAHTYSRTHFLYEQFTKAFSLAKKLIITPTFSAREENIFELSEDKFAADCGGEYISDFEEIAHRVAKIGYDCVVMMGAGDLSSHIKKLI